MLVLLVLVKASAFVLEEPEQIFLFVFCLFFVCLLPSFDNGEFLADW